MKIVLSLIFSIFISSLCLAQTNLDTTWIENKQKYRLALELDENPSNDDLNTKLTLFKNNKRIISDSISCTRLSVELEDWNGDGFKDLLIFQAAGARSNETYNLFLFQKTNSSFKKVGGFNAWPNLNKTTLKSILAACILTGTVEYRFFKLKDSGELIDLKISQTDSLLDGTAYNLGLQRVKRLKN